MKKMLYINGDSYSFCMGNDLTKTTAGHIAKHLNAKLEFRAISGSCNARILRTAMRDIIKHSSEYDMMVVVGLSFLHRTEIWNPNDTKLFDNLDGDFRSYQYAEDESWWQKIKDRVYSEPAKRFDNRAESYLKEFMRSYDVEAETVRLLTGVIGLASLCKSKGIQYIIFNNAEKLQDIDWEAPFITDFYKEVKNDKQILSLTNFSFRDYCLDKGYVGVDVDKFGKFAHHGKDAHKDFAEYLINMYNL